VLDSLLFRKKPSGPADADLDAFKAEIEALEAAEGTGAYPGIELLNSWTAKFTPDPQLRADLLLQICE
jgi:hypothetical protein